MPIIIKNLPEEVINRIAAGERPFNAIKELLENSLDAGATSISIVCKEGGLKLLQIQDNGSGIHKEDLELLCERFATSKLQKFEDLKSIQSFGFRGEALASISHVARVTVTTKTADSPCAYRAFYMNGKLSAGKEGQPQQSAEPKPCAGNQGTTIQIEDLFYNVPMRRNAFKNANEEYTRIVEVISRYAIHYHKVGFQCRKVGGNSVDVSTKSAETALEAIKLVAAPSDIWKELTEIRDIDDATKTEIYGLVTHTGFHLKKSTFILFINGRLVESLIIRKAIETVYGRFLLKGTHPWVYLSLTMPAHRVDVNMHPTKKEVRFLDEDGVIDAIVKVLTTKLAEFGSSQKFSVHRLGGSGLAPPPLPPPRTPITSQLACSIGGSGGTPSQSHQQTPFTEVVDQRSSFQSQQTPKSTPAHKLVRTDPKEQSIMSMFRRSSMTATAHSTGEDLNVDQDVDDVTDVRQGDFVEIERKSIIDNDQIEDNEHCDLTSINELRDEYKQRQNSELCETFRSYTFVGVVDAHRALIQYQKNLLFVNYHELTKLTVYEMVLENFSKMKAMSIRNAPSISSLISLSLENNVYSLMEDFDKDPDEVQKFLSDRSEMMSEYFSISFAGGMVRSLPMIIENYAPSDHKLPAFIHRLYTEVNWNNEKECFRDIAACLGWFYAPFPYEISEQDNDLLGDEEWKVGYRNQIEYEIFPALRKATMTEDMMEYVLEIAELGKLYRIFERC